jgi:hypothetical protein
MKAPPQAIHELRIILKSLYILVNIRYGSLTVSRRKRISHESRGAEVLIHKSLAPREHILSLDVLFDGVPRRLSMYGWPLNQAGLCIHVPAPRIARAGIAHSD